MKLRKTFLILCSLALLVTFVSLISYGNMSSVINIFVNNTQLMLDEPPVKINNRILVPVRAVMEALGANVSWDASNRVVTAKNHDTIVTMPIDSAIVYKNDLSVPLDVPAQIINGRTFIPFRFISESLGADVHWDSKNQTVLISKEEAHRNFSVKNITIGSSLEDVSKVLGSAQRTVISEYGFQWYTFHNQYRDYLQLGIQDNKVVAIYSNQPLWENKYNINVGTNKEMITSSLSQPLDGIVKGNTKYLFPPFEEGTEYEVFHLGSSYVTIFYDLHKGNEVSSILIIDKDVEESYLRHLNSSIELKEAFEKQVFDLANALRVREGLKPFEWSEVASSAATKHSKDMADHRFFDHINLKGESPFDRMKQEGIRYRSAGENLAAGQQNPIYAHEGWMNSIGHRKALLGNYEKLGVGVWFGGSNAKFNNYFTQKFYTP
ncbi:stalk domain-containing protein [Alkaliphilus transvaalensis]|uniref:stalk domain-containing protein n=1 Tax=Alkaliphilus transvaalensis TaxID=114628 RepID=UPI0004798568|nr:stalk domain-containing protein [Alkaliphilus transvaalensis]